MHLKILMIDDHPMILNGFQAVLTANSEHLKFEFSKAHNSIEALLLLKKNKNEPFDIIFLDIQLPTSLEDHLIDGEELGYKIKTLFNTKILIITSLFEKKRIQRIFENIKPEGFMNKAEASPETLLEAIEALMNNKTYISPSIKKRLQTLSAENSFLNLDLDLDLDLIDLKILTLIAAGEQMKNLPNFIPSSLTSIERRKRRMKKLFKVQSNSNRELLEKAREQGFL